MSTNPTPKTKTVFLPIVDEDGLKLLPVEIPLEMFDVIRGKAKPKDEAVITAKANRIAPQLLEKIVIWLLKTGEIKAEMGRRFLGLPAEKMGEV